MERPIDRWRWSLALALAALCLALAGCGLALAGCGQKSSTQPAPQAQEGGDAGSPAQEKGAPRTITDLGGAQVGLPAVQDIKRVVVVSPPVMSFVLETIPDTKSIAGANSRCFNTANTQVMDRVFPDWNKVDTAFIDAGFTVNKESLLALKPDVILYYGKVQKQGLGDIDVPCVDFFSKSAVGPEAVSAAWSDQLRTIFGLDSSKGQQVAWDRSNKKLEELLKGRTEKKSALCVFSDAGGSLTVSGKDAFDAYAQSFFTMSGLRNVAEDLEGSVNVSMEQVYQWDPDLIVVFQDAPAQDLLDNKVSGQDWSLLKAWKNKAIYDVPRTTFAWITPCADASLMPLWLASKAYPESYSDKDFRTDLAQYYQQSYSLSLTEEDLDSILGYRKASAS